jgi:hypothetical protein
VTEAEGCALLLARFVRAGFKPLTNVRFQEGGIDVELDGWDPVGRVGFEYITREAGDDRSFDDVTLGNLESRMARGELYLLLVDERDAVTSLALELAADGFLDEVSRRRGAP